MSYLSAFEILFNISWVKVISTLGRWILEKAGAYNPLSGVTTNQSEGFNCMLKRLQSWREVSVNVAVMALRLQAFYVSESQRGLSGKHTHLH